MPRYTQDSLPMKVDTQLGENVLLLTGFAGEEGMSTPFAFTLDLLSENAAIDGAQLLRTPAVVTLDLPGGDERVTHGLIRRFVQLGKGKELTAYRAEVAPWLWFLSLSSDCKIFQNLSVLEIVEQVFQAQGFSDFDIQCRRSYPTREYCVQYRETHLNFVSRLLEEEGIFYFFKHEDDKHTLMLVDDSTPVDPCPAQSVARMNPQPGAFQEEDVVNNIQLEHGVHSGKVTLRDYSYTDPALQLETSVSGNGIGEVYDYPGSYTDTAGDGNAPQQLERYARLLRRIAVSRG